MWKFLSILVLIFAFQAQGQVHKNYHVRNFNMTDGMPSNSVREIFKDRDGFLWIGTEAGLCRFDGKNFRIYTREDGFEGNQIWAITQDNRGNMWFGDYGLGLWKYDGKRFTLIKEGDSLCNSYIRKLYFSSKFNLLMIGTQKGLTVFDGKKYMNVKASGSWLDDEPNIMGFIERENEIEVITFSTSQFIYYPKQGTLKPMQKGHVKNIPGMLSCFRSSDGKTFLGYRWGLHITNDREHLKNIIKPFNSPENENIGMIFDMAEDRYGNIWLASWEPDPSNTGGLFIWNGSGVLKMNEILGEEISQGWPIFYDKATDILWFGSLEKGLFMIHESEFRYFTAKDFGLGQLAVNDLIIQKDGSRYILGKKNLIRQKADGSYIVYPNQPFYQAFVRILKKLKYQDPRITDYESFINILSFGKMTFDRDGRLLIMGEPGLFSVDTGTGQVICIERTGYGNGIIFVDTLGRVWHAPYWGPYQLFRDTCPAEELLQFDKSTDHPVDITDVEKRGDVYWMASRSKGIFLVRDTVFTNFNSTNTPISNAIHSVCFDHYGNLVAGSGNGELYYCSVKGESLRVLYTIHQRDGLLGNSINWVAVDRNNQCWIGTNTGLNRLDLNLLFKSRKVKILHYTGEEGYRNHKGNFAITGPDGNIWVGTDEHLLKIDCSKKDVFIPAKKRIILSGYSVNSLNRSRNISFSKDKGINIELKYSENYLDFVVDVLNYSNPGKDRFRYFLKGLDNRWTMFTDRRAITYSNIPPGKYTLMVEGRNTNTGEEYEPLYMGIRIKPPFWKTWWFISLFIAALIIGNILYFRNRIARARNIEKIKAEISGKLARLEMQALLAQMNPHFTFNAINSIQNYILDNDVDKALQYLSDFSKIIRQTLDNATREFITLEEELDYLGSYLRLEQMRFDKQFSLEIKVDDSIDQTLTLIPPMLLQPYVENAIKHGLRHRESPGKLSVRFELAGNDAFKCIIEDNGIGIKASEQLNIASRKDHTGAGMNITGNRIRKLKELYDSEYYTIEVGNLSDEDGNPAGTRVEIFLPLTER